MTTLHLRKDLKGRDVIDVESESGKLLATIYPTGENAIHIVSSHFTEPAIEATSGAFDVVPGYAMRFKP